MRIIFITGASGSGKTTLVKSIERKQGADFGFYYLDSVGVPGTDEMTAQYGSGDEWQRQTTLHWVDAILRDSAHDVAILEGQMRLAFITEACKTASLTDYKIVLLDCSDAERKVRLVARGQAGLATDDMMNWATYLRMEAEDADAVILDTSGLDVKETRDLFLRILQN